MAAALPTSDQMTGSRAGEYPVDSKSALDSATALNTLRAAQQLYELARRQIPQEVVDLSQEPGHRPAMYNSMPLQRWSNYSGAYADTSMLHHSQNYPVAELGGFSNEGYDGVQSLRGEEPSFRISEENSASRRAYQHSAGDSSLDKERERELLTFPEGEADAVTITERDMEGLQSTGFLSNNIIDFYIKYLERRSLSPEDRNRFYFFNSFFFTKLLGNGSASTVEYEQVRKWSGAVNLFEKDYVFVPVLQSSHWSLIIMCNLTAASCSPDKRKGSLIVFHLDSIEGKHESFEGQVRSYLLDAWMDRYQAANNKDQLLALCQMKYVQAQVPQQENGYDCGLYLLHYVETFLRESTSPDFSFALSNRGLHFTGPHFAAEVSAKRMAIEKLIFELVRISKEQAAKRTEIKNLSQELRLMSQKLLMCLDGKGVSRGRFEDVPSNGVVVFDAGQGNDKDAVHLSTAEFAVDNQHQRRCTETEHIDHPTTWKLALHTKPAGAVEVPHAEYQSTGDVVLDMHQQPQELSSAVLRKQSKGTNKRGRNWTVEETSILLNCKAEGGRFYKEKQAATRWDIISQEIGTRLGTMPSEDQCRLRYDTLLKAYKTSTNYCLKTGKPFSEISEEERREWKLAETLMRKEWYEVIDEICRRWPHKSKSQKRAKRSRSDDDGLDPVIPCNPALLSLPAPAPASASVPVPPISAAAPIPAGSYEVENVSHRQVAIPGFRGLEEDLKRTLLHLIQVMSLEYWLARNSYRNGDEMVFELEELCEWLAIVQDRKAWDISKFIFQLLKRKLVNIEEGPDYGEFEGLNLSSLWVQHKKFLKKVLVKNPNFNIYVQECHNCDLVSFPRAPLSLSLRRIRVLSLYRCYKLEHADLSSFPELRSLDISFCGKLKAVTGWEVVKELGWLEIRYCGSYADFPWVQFLASLRKFVFESNGGPLVIELASAPDFRQCVRLRRLEIWGGDSTTLTSMDLSTLRFLEVLNICNCSALTTIQGLSGLHSLTKLVLTLCKAMRGVPELGCLKALTHLDLRESGVKEIAGVQELHLLTSLDLFYCLSLKTLPCLGHLKALAHLDMRGSGVEEIPGVQDLVSLELLQCDRSRLKRLPDLRHLRRLERVSICHTPLSTDSDPPSFHDGVLIIYFPIWKEYNEFSDVIDSDTEDSSYSADGSHPMKSF